MSTAHVMLTVRFVVKGGDSFIVRKPHPVADAGNSLVASAHKYGVWTEATGIGDFYPPDSLLYSSLRYQSYCPDCGYGELVLLLDTANKQATEHQCVTSDETDESEPAENESEPAESDTAESARPKKKKVARR